MTGHYSPANFARFCSQSLYVDTKIFKMQEKLGELVVDSPSTRSAAASTLTGTEGSDALVAATRQLAIQEVWFAVCCSLWRGAWCWKAPRMMDRRRAFFSRQSGIFAACIDTEGEVALVVACCRCCCCCCFVFVFVCLFGFLFAICELHIPEAAILIREPQALEVMKTNQRYREVRPVWSDLTFSLVRFCWSVRSCFVVEVCYVVSERGWTLLTETRGIQEHVEA